MLSVAWQSNRNLATTLRPSAGKEAKRTRPHCCFCVPSLLQPETWSYVQVQWNASHAQSYVNSSLCGSVESGYDVAGGNGWGSTANDILIDPSSSSQQSTLSSGGVGGSSGNSDSLLVGAWRGAPDGAGLDRRGGYYTGLLDNLEVRRMAVGQALSGGNETEGLIEGSAALSSVGAGD